MVVNWNDVLSNRQNVRTMTRFASGDLSRNDLLNFFREKESYGEVNRLIRDRGAMYARRLARKALRRRGIEVQITE